MEFDRFGDERHPDLLFVLGWGNRPTHEPVRWLLDRLAEDWRVHTATLPVHATDVQREWVDPVSAYAAALTNPAVLAHSAGGLTVAHADIESSTTTYLSPWWGFSSANGGRLVDLFARFPLDVKLLPSGIDDPSLLGAHATARQVTEGADRVSPAFLRTVQQAHRTLPPAKDEAVVFCSLTDQVVSTRAIGERVPAERIRLYDGGHELFSSRSRERQLATLRAVLSEGPAGLEA
ncbi:alpha/beta hydrolase [Halorhabdus sp. CBA1104]|uniref:alpha/beta hydrolase n=1 Tax=Halorhabdus sp. CBA1104 TaxID=1380432 RepID=UPI0012B1A8A1|nr:alpha/beta fold hydrolase [Halorhabdus sp. CBA1104]QGN06146.1 alpha/beta hydrolase [Halorhabdus sp. CBA1104]